MCPPIVAGFGVQFEEVSNIRDVPDHQSGGVCGPPRDEILIFELLELKHDVADNGSGTWFLQDLLGKRDVAVQLGFLFIPLRKTGLISFQIF
ncbi:hypothetical protein L2E82_43767 [Cichorium intybus]|uniref:Uncharacterized protein n=1 Tax=Cichorium intybus TaxID=13427 RepID=A0ACB8ZPG4_CICIN|nr:hypothetical protein L2E82_43767 [Cichorium intybus]